MSFDDIEREFAEAEREGRAEQARLYRQLTDAERLAHFFAHCACTRFERSPPHEQRIRRIRDRERDEVGRRLDEALNGPPSER